MRLTRVTLVLIAVIIAAGFYQLAVHFLSDVEPQTFQIGRASCRERV
jgi:hypothetical protein